MRREFVLNILFLVLINLIIKPFYTFFIETDIQNLIGPEDYGVYFSLFNLSYIFQIVLDMGIHNYGSQFLAKDNSDSKSFLSLALSTKALLTIVFTAVILIACLLLGYKGEMRIILYLVSFNQICISLIFFFRSALAALGYYRMNSVVSVLDKLLMIFAFVYVLHISSSFRAQFDLMDFIGIRMGAYLITVLIAWIILSTIGGHMLRWEFDRKSAYGLMKKSIPFAIIVIFMGLSNRTDAVMLERMLDDSGQQAGVYAASYRIFYALNTIGFLFSMLLLPMFSNLLVENRKELHQLVDLSLKTIMVLSIGAVAMVYLMRNEIMAMLYKEDAILYGTNILMVLCLAFIFSSAIYILGTLLTANAQLKYLNWLFVGATVINILVNALVIPVYGALGAAGATLLTHIVVLLGQFFLCYWIVPLRLSYRSIFTMVMFVTVIGLSVYYGSEYSGDLLLKCAVAAFGILVFSLFIKMIDVKLLYQLVSDRSDQGD